MSLAINNIKGLQIAMSVKVAFISVSLRERSQHQQKPRFQLSRPRRLLSALGFALTISIGLGSLAVNDVNAEQSPREMEEVLVVSITPAGGTMMDLDSLPFSIQSATGDDLGAAYGQTASEYLSTHFSSVHLSDTQNNPLQRDIYYRGFSSSPLLGLSQGLSVYQNGVRINDVLGDAVHYDLIPESAIHQVTLFGGGNPVFGLNTLGGALSYDMKDGFDLSGLAVSALAGSARRRTVDLEVGGNNGLLGYYLNLSQFDDQGWRDESPSDARTAYAVLSYRGERIEYDLDGQFSDTHLVGNGAVPVGLLAVDREAVFTSPDKTLNKLSAVTLRGQLILDLSSTLGGTVFYRDLNTHSFNGDASEYEVCHVGSGHSLTGQQVLVEEDELRACVDGVIDHDDILATAAQLRSGRLAFIDDLEALDGINNISDRDETSYGMDFQLTSSWNWLDGVNQLVLGTAYVHARSGFDAALELASLGQNRSTENRGTGIFVHEEATDISAQIKTFSLYMTDTLALSRTLKLTLAGRYNHSDVRLRDRSGERPELDGDHTFNRFNPAIGVTYQIRDLLDDEVNLFGSYSESSRIPTPVELSCNDSIAAAFNERTGEDFECRLPNAFLADPPLQQVITQALELGVRARHDSLLYNYGLFVSRNQNDIVFQSTGRTTGLFANVDETQRVGAELGLSSQWREMNWRLSYSYVRATFGNSFTALAGAGEVQQVSRGDRIPGIPLHQFKAGLDYRFTSGIDASLEFAGYSDQVLRGDEANRLSTVDGYVLVNLRAGYEIRDNISLLLGVNNVMNSDFETFGIVGEDPREVVMGLEDDRNIFLGPGPPRQFFFGIDGKF